MILTAPGHPFVVGHRGTPAHAPENTLPGFLLALEQGAVALELDVHLSADGHPVVIHDPDTDRTTGVAGAVATLAADELAALDAGATWTRTGGDFPWRDRGATIPRLAAVLAATAVPLIVELKTARASLPVLQLLREHGATGRVLVGGFDEAALAPFRDTEVAVAGGRERIARLWRRAHTRLGRRSLDVPAFAVPDRWRGLVIPTRPFVRAAARGGAAVHVWTVDDPHRARRLWARGVSGIITNDPRALAAAGLPPEPGAPPA